MSEGWIGVDLDGTLAEYDTWRGETHIGVPVPLMAERVRRWLHEGRDVRIFTARAHEASYQAVAAIQEWCKVHLGRVLPITNVKDYHMVELWDDRAIQVVPNTGRWVGDLT